MRRSSASEVALAAVAMLLGALVFTWPLAAHPALILPGPGDSKYNAWVLGWVADRARHGLSGVWDAPIYFPYSNTLVLAEPLFGIAVPLAPFYWLGANAVLLHNIAVWASFVVAGTGGYLLGRDLTGSRGAGAVCGTIAAFLPYRLSHLSHIQVLMAAWLWWTAWSIHRYFRTPTLGGVVRSAAFYALLGLSSLYWAYIGALPLVTIAVVEAWRRRGPVRTWLVHAGVACLLIAVVFFPVASHMRSLTATGGPIAETVDRFSYAADILAYVTGHRNALIWGSLTKNGAGETDLFPGLTALVCAAMLLIYGRRPCAGAFADPWNRVYAILGLLGIMLSLGPTPAFDGRVIFANPLLPWLAAHAPGFGQLRTTARFAVIAQLALSVLAARGMAAWLARPARRASGSLVAVSVVVTLIFTEGLALPAGVFVFSPFEGSSGRRLVHWLAQRPGGAVVELPLDGWGHVHYSPIYQARTLVHGHPIIEGTSRYSPPLARQLADADSPLADPERISEALPFLRSLGVRFVVVHESWFAEPALGARIHGALSDAVGGAAADFPETTVFDLGEAPAGELVVPGPDGALEPTQVSTTSGEARLMLDGNLETRWHTDRTQEPGDAIEIVLPAPQIVSGVRLHASDYTFNEYPRRLEIDVAETLQASGVRVFSGSVLQILGSSLRSNPVAPAIDIRWPQRLTARIRLSQTGRSARWTWSVHELRVLGSSAD